MIYSMILMIEDVEEADVFEEDVQMFEFLLRRLFQVRNLLLVIFRNVESNREFQGRQLVLEITYLFLFRVHNDFRR